MLSEIFFPLLVPKYSNKTLLSLKSFLEQSSLPFTLRSHQYISTSWWYGLVILSYYLNIFFFEWFNLMSCFLSWLMNTITPFCRSELSFRYVYIYTVNWIHCYCWLIFTISHWCWGFRTNNFQILLTVLGCNCRGVIQVAPGSCMRVLLTLSSKNVPLAFGSFRQTLMQDSQLPCFV